MLLVQDPTTARVSLGEKSITLKSYPVSEMLNYIVISIILFILIIDEPESRPTIIAYSGFV